MPTTHAPRPHTVRTLLILGVAALAFALAQTTLIPALPRARARAAHRRERRRVDDHGLPARGRGLHAGRRPPRRHVRQAPAARDRAARVRRRLGRLRARRRRSGSSSPAASCRASAAASSRSASGSSATSSRATGSPASIGLLSALVRRSAAALGLVIGGLVVDHVSYHWIFWLGAIMGARGGGRRPAARAGVARSAARAASTSAAPSCSASASCCRCSAISQANDWGWGAARTLGLIAAGARRPGRLGRAGAPHRAAARRHRDARQAAGADDQHRDAARRLRHVRLVHPDPAARRGADLDRLRLRPRRHRRGPADAPRRRS